MAPSSRLSTDLNISAEQESEPDRGGQVAKGMVLMAIAMLMLPIMDGIAKMLTLSYDVTAGQTTIGRFFVQAILLCPVVMVVLGPAGLWPRRLFVNLIRGGIMSLAVMIFFATLRYMPIADAIAVFFIEPFFLTVLSVIILKEKVGWRRSMAVVVGFAGALLIIQPSYAIFGAVSLMPIATAFLFAVYLILTRQIAGQDHPLTMQFIAGLGGVATLLTVTGLAGQFGVEDFSAPEIPEFGIRWTLIFAIGALATIGHLMVVMAFRLASASVLAPFQYLEIVMATAIGYWLFGEFPDALKWLGIAIIITSGIYLFMREKALAEQSG
ncbi:MAG: DMT family transporter [Pseudomonadota bacterium]